MFNPKKALFSNLPVICVSYTGFHSVHINSFMNKQGFGASEAIFMIRYMCSHVYIINYELFAIYTVIHVQIRSESRIGFSHREMEAIIMVHFGGGLPDLHGLHNPPLPNSTAITGHCHLPS